MNLQLKTHNEYLNINFDNVTDENINKYLLTKRINKITKIVAVISFITGIIGSIINFLFIPIISLIIFAISLYLYSFEFFNKDIESSILGVKNTNYWDKIIALKEIIQEMDMNKKILFQSDFTKLLYLKKNSNVYFEYELPLNEIKYSESDDYNLTFDENTLNIILYVPIKYMY